ncbi:MAG TPA: hypothetical protein PLI53_02405, partial [Geobacteraceae bacterium]|nr:hypothetical protein [Geobacteraceae bacterium]
DSLDSRGTGELADLLAREVESRGWGRCGSVTRHQLYVHPEIPYTSHNSSMCFIAEMDAAHLGALTEYASEFLAGESAEGSDPGLCIAVAERLARPEALIDYGYRAKRSVIEMQEAYMLASAAGVHLSSHGGTGQGVIGALAGVGLRLGGNDGRMRGSLVIPEVDGVATVREILVHPEVDAVRTLEGVRLDPEDRVRFVDKVKTVLLGGKLVLLVVPDDSHAGSARWKTCTRKQLKEY